MIRLPSATNQFFLRFYFILNVLNLFPPCLQEALDTLQFTKEDQEHAFGLLAAVLWIGNITFQTIDSENHVEVMANEGNARTKICTTLFKCGMHLVTPDAII